MKYVTCIVTALYALLIVTALFLAFDSFAKYGPEREVAELLKGISFVCISLYFLAKVCVNIKESREES